MSNTQSSTTTIQLSSDLYRQEYRPSFVDKWDELIDWERRAEGENGFFTRLLREHGCRRVLDVAAGTGYHAITLTRDGFDVLAADGAESMIRKTRENADRWGVELPTTVADWRQLSKHVDGQFDAIVCLGNAFTHLFDEDDRVMALAEFRRVLRAGGILVIDHRNYDYILDNGFRSKHKYYYCGREVDARPIEIDINAVKFQYSFPDGSRHFLTLHPIRLNRMKTLLENAGFRNLTSYGDFEEDYDFDDTDFVVHVAATG